ncbi:MAG: hypothetical protein ACI3YE_00060 [Candidatus Avispirillum sp.]
MSDNKENKNITAKDLLERLSKQKGEESRRDAPTYSDFLKKREENEAEPAPAEPAETETPEAEAPAEYEEADNAEAAEEYGEAWRFIDGDAEGYGTEFAEDTYAETAEPAEYAEPTEYAEPEMSEAFADEPYADPAAEQEPEDFADEEPAGDDIYPDDGFAPEEGADGGYDEYADYAPQDGEDYSDYAPEQPIDFDGFDPAADTYTEQYGEKYGEQYNEQYRQQYGEDAPHEEYGDIIPDDDFFDNDPIEDEPEEEESAVPEPQEEYDETRDFENLVAEVTGDSGDELDEKDISLMVALGMEDELAKSVGSETATQMTDDYVADQEEWVDRTHRFGSDEYTDPAENGEIADKYRRRNRIAFWEMIACFAVALVLLIFENLPIPIIGYQPSGALDPLYYPVVYLMFDLQFVMIGAALTVRQLGRGLAGLVKFKPCVETVPAVMALVSIVVTVITAYNAVPGVEPKVFNFPTVLCFLLAAISEYMTVRREIFSFNIVSSKKPKYVMRRLSTRDSVLESEAAADIDSAVADEGDIIKIQKTDFVDGYFWRTRNRGTQGRSYVGLAMVISFALAILAGIYAGVSGKESPLPVAFAVLSAAMPSSMVILGCYPFYRANRQAYENDSTIIGEGSVEEYSGVGVISFDDVNVFPSNTVKVRNVRLFNNCRIDKVLYYAASVFSATGGPLADVFEVATMETGHSENVEVLETGAGYIEATVNGRSIMFGSAAALSRLGIILPEEVVSENTELPVDCTVMYMIYQRKLVAKMIVNYVIDPDFEYILKQLTGSGMCVCVKTFDPNIDEDMIYRQIRSGKYSLRVIKYKNTEEITKYSRRAEGGVVSRGTTKSLLHTVSSCDRILSAQKTGFVMGIIAAILSAVIMGVVLIAGSFGSMYSLYIALCQLFWLIPVIITTKLIVR